MRRHFRHARAAAAAAHERSGAVLIGALLLALFLSLSYLKTDGKFSSVEVKFADASESGLSIVPASCPSSPHYSNECIPNPPPPPPGIVSDSCRLWASSYSVQPGQSTTLYWDSNMESIYQGWNYEYVSGSISPTPGSVGESGSASVSPGAPTQYIYTANLRYSHPWFPWLVGGQGSYTCDVTISVGGTSCPAGQVTYNGSCIPIGSCPAGYQVVGGACIPYGTCPTGYAWNGFQCVVTSCPSGYSLIGGTCVLTSCPSGYLIVNGSCVAEASLCQPRYYCVGDTLYNQTPGAGGACSASVYQACDWGCAGSACLPPPPPQIVTWRVAPILVRAPGTAQVTWDVRNVRSCTVSGDNGDSWSNTTGRNSQGSQRSSALIGRTVFTLTCQGYDNSTVSLSETVNIVPIFDEQ